MPRARKFFGCDLWEWRAPETKAADYDDDACVHISPEEWPDMDIKAMRHMVNVPGYLEIVAYGKRGVVFRVAGWQKLSTMRPSQRPSRDKLAELCRDEISKVFLLLLSLNLCGRDGGGAGDVVLFYNAEQQKLKASFYGGLKFRAGQSRPINSDELNSIDTVIATVLESISADDEVIEKAEIELAAAEKKRRRLEIMRDEAAVREHRAAEEAAAACERARNARIELERARQAAESLKVRVESLKRKRGE